MLTDCGVLIIILSWHLLPCANDIRRYHSLVRCNFAACGRRLPLVRRIAFSNHTGDFSSARTKTSIVQAFSRCSRCVWADSWTPTLPSARRLR